MVGKARQMVRPVAPALIPLLKERFVRVGEVLPGDSSSFIRASKLSELCAREEVLAARLHIPRQQQVDLDLNLAFSMGRGMHHIFQEDLFAALPEFFVGQWRCGNCHRALGGLSAPEGNISRPASCPDCLVDDGTCPEPPLFRFVEQFFVNEQFQFSGHNDGFLRFLDFPHLGDGVFELKSISALRAKDIKDVPDLGHVVQAQAYMWLSGVKWALILYWNKGEYRDSLTEHFVERDEDTIEQIQVLLQGIQDGVRSGALPPRICSSSDCNRAESCPLAVSCFQLEDKAP